jgi:flagellar FliL protein
MTQVQTQAAPAPADAPPAAAPAKKRPLLLYGAIGLVVLGALGAGGWFLYPRVFGAPKSGAAEARVEVPVRTTVSLGAVVVNLADDPRRYLRVAVGLGVPGPKEAKEIEELKPQLLDLLIGVLSSTEVDTLTSEEGRAELKETLLSRIREELKLERVGRVYFTEFVIQ